MDIVTIIIMSENIDSACRRIEYNVIKSLHRVRGTCITTTDLQKLFKPTINFTN